MNSDEIIKQYQQSVAAERYLANLETAKRKLELAREVTRLQLLRKMPLIEAERIGVN
jgi:hypothetical protein